jgi:succinyl-diaminopimelate desuccinylase
LLPEPTSGVVWNANRGAITLEVTVRGRAAHVGLQHQGTNAVERALPLLTRFFGLQRELEAQGGSRFYAERGVPALAYGPGILSVSHGPQEFVKMGRMAECAKIYALTAARMLAGE